MTNIKVDNDVPMPEPPTRGRRKWPFDTMKVGDSFFVPVEQCTSLRAAAFEAKKAKKLLGYTTSTRVENGVKGVRVWRTE